MVFLLQNLFGKTKIIVVDNWSSASTITANYLLSNFFFLSCSSTAQLTSFLAQTWGTWNFRVRENANESELGWAQLIHGFTQRMFRLPVKKHSTVRYQLLAVANNPAAPVIIQLAKTSLHLDKFQRRILSCYSVDTTRAINMTKLSLTAIKLVWTQ